MKEGLNREVGVYRRRFAGLLILSSACVLTLPALLHTPPVAAAQSAATAEGDHPEFPQGQGRDATLRLCSQCHSVNIILANGQSREGWEDTITKMVRFGAHGNDEDFTDIADYLTANFPPSTVKKIFVNQATEQDFATALGVSVDEGKAIVAYRDQIKGFNSLDDLKKAPGLDAAKVDANKEKLIFGAGAKKPA
ncbi:MAG TPA: helix-hairpin-helix domain-containing protein [Acidobacteriaceae bacterium]